MKDIDSFNIALLNKRRWQILTDNDVVWSDLVSFRYDPIIQKILHKEDLRIHQKDSLWRRDLLMLQTSSSRTRDVFVECLLQTWK